MTFLESYLDAIDKPGKTISPQIRTSTDKLFSEHIDRRTEPHLTGMILGRVQSGKTGQVLAVASKAADSDYRVFVLLTTDNVLLQQQTINRAFGTLDSFNICDENDYSRFDHGALRKPTMLVLKKNATVLRRWVNRLRQVPAVSSEPLFLIDDEADAASLNTKINQGEVSTINSLIDEMRTLFPSSTYLQCTATPQAPLLQPENSRMRPSFVHITHPGGDYLGGNFFYGSSTKCQKKIPGGEVRRLLARDSDIPEGLLKAIQTFLVTSVVLRRDEESDACNCLVHPSHLTAHHATVAEKVSAAIAVVQEGLSRDDPLLMSSLNEVCDDLRETYPDLGDSADIVPALPQAIQDVRVLVLNSVSETDRDYQQGLNIIIGGNSLGRGVTFPKLQTVYYCRIANTPQADTVWQHSRLFGYDRTAGLCRLFLAPDLPRLLMELTEAEEALFGLIEERGVDGVSVLTPAGTRATRTSVTDQETLTSFVGGVNYFIGAPNSNGLASLDSRLPLHDIDRSASFDEVLEILTDVTVDDIDLAELESYRGFVAALKECESVPGCRLMVRAGRNLSKNTGVMLSPKDREAIRRVGTDLVLVMYRLEGLKEQGWSGKPLWMPGVRFPSGYVFLTSTI